MIDPLHIIIDSREQSPWSWEPSDAVTEIAGLVAGDYALASDTEAPRRKGQLRPVRFAVERKSLEDFLGTISTGWDRFQRELDKMASWPARVVIVEGDFEDVCFKENVRMPHETLEDGTPNPILPPPHNHPSLRPSFVARRIAELAMQGVTVLLAGDAGCAAGLAYRIFRRRQEACE